MFIVSTLAGVTLIIFVSAISVIVGFGSLLITVGVAFTFGGYIFRLS